MRKTLTDKGVAALKPRSQRYARPDPELRGHYIRVQSSGAKTFAAVARDPVRKKQIWTTIESTDVLSIVEAREQAREIIKRVRAGKLARESLPSEQDSFHSIAELWLKRHVQKKGLRSEHKIRRLLDAHVYRQWKDRAFLDLRRNDVTYLLDEVEDDHGARQADYVLAIVRGIMNWHATRHDGYVPPIVKGMRRTNPKERARDRVFDDAELAAILKAAESDGAFGAIIKILLLTAQRREKVISMRWADISEGVWTIPSEDREKGNAGRLALPDLAAAIIYAQPRLGDNPYVFGGRDKGHFNGLSKSKRLFDTKLPRMPQWQLHDLRRTDEFIRSGVRAEHIDGSTPKLERDAALARLASSEVELISNCMVLTEGWDMPAIGCCILARPTKKMGLYRQMIGRVLRPAEGKADAIILDHSGAVFRHGFAEDHVEWALDPDRRAKSPAHQKRSEKHGSRLLECKQCSAVRVAGEPCFVCGYLPQPAPRAIEIVDGELGLVDRKRRVAIDINDPAVRSQWHAQLAYIAEERGYKPGWIAHKFKEKFGTYPPWGRVSPLPPSPEVRSWVRSRQIAFAKATRRRA